MIVCMHSFLYLVLLCRSRQNVRTAKFSLMSSLSPYGIRAPKFEWRLFCLPVLAVTKSCFSCKLRVIAHAPFCLLCWFSFILQTMHSRIAQWHFPCDTVLSPLFLCFGDCWRKIKSSWKSYVVRKWDALDLGFSTSRDNLPNTPPPHPGNFRVGGGSVRKNWDHRMTDMDCWNIDLHHRKIIIPTLWVCHRPCSLSRQNIRNREKVMW